MTEAFDEYGDLLRRALHAEADTVVPSADGLDQIRERISTRQRRFALWFAVPWLRPLAAVGIALFIAAIAVTAKPAIQRFTSAGQQQGRTGGTIDSPGVVGGLGEGTQLSPGAASKSGVTPNPSSSAPVVPPGSLTPTTVPCPPGKKHPPAASSTPTPGQAKPPKQSSPCKTTPPPPTTPTAGPTTPPPSTPTAGPSSQSSQPGIGSENRSP